MQTATIPLSPVAMQPHWLPLVEQCASARSASKLPKLDSELGPGRWKLKGESLVCLPKTHLRYRLHWKTSSKQIVVGFFDAPKTKGVQEVGVQNEAYRAIVELCAAQNGVVIGLPSLETELGYGLYKCERGALRKDGYFLCILYWERPGKWTRLGSFVLDASVPSNVHKPVAKPKSRKIEQAGELTLGVDALGRRTIRVACANNSKQYIAVAVEYEWVRGERMPKPVHDAVAQAFGVQGV